MGPVDALLTASALHVGFQLVVTVVVYPTLAEVRPARWRSAHDTHSGRISWVVAPLYVVVAASCLWVLVAGPRDGAALVAVAGNAVAALATAAVAAPTHSRLGREGPSPELITRLLRADRARLAGALVALVAALLAV